MPARVTCQTCGTGVDAQFARVYGTDDDEVYACLSCSTHSALVNGAAVAPDRDGTPLVHRPDRAEPVPATIDEAETDDDVERYALAEPLFSRLAEPGVLVPLTRQKRTCMRTALPSVRG